MKRKRWQLPGPSRTGSDPYRGAVPRRQPIQALAISLATVMIRAVRRSAAFAGFAFGALVFFSPPPAHAGRTWDFLTTKAHWSGYLKNETAYRFREPRVFTKIRNIVYVRGDLPVSENVDFTLSGWAYYDLAFDLFDNRTIAARPERDIVQPLNFIEGLPAKHDSPVAAIREAYMDVYLDKLDLRIGKQYVIWGVLTGVRIVDEINPMDFRELILPDLIDYRIPLFTFKADYYGENNAYQFLWIPELKFHKPAPSGSEWELLQEVPGTTYPEGWNWKNSEFGFRIARTVWDTELTLDYFYTWDDFPVQFRHSPVNANVNSPLPVFHPTYTRIRMYGGTFQRSFFGQVLKGEIAYVTGKYFGTESVDRDGDGFTDNEGELQRNHIRWGIGLDFNIWKTDFSPAFTQWVILDYAPEIIQDRFDSTFNLFVRKELPLQGAVFSLLGIYLINLHEVYLKPKMTFNVTERFQIAAGFDLFHGKRSQLGVGAVRGRATEIVELTQRSQFIGNFFENDRLFLEFKYAF